MFSNLVQNLLRLYINTYPAYCIFAYKPVFCLLMLVRVVENSVRVNSRCVIVIFKFITHHVFAYNCHVYILRPLFDMGHTSHIPVFIIVRLNCADNPTCHVVYIFTSVYMLKSLHTDKNEINQY